MPELPEAERARRQLERVVGREIVAVDDADTYVCRPHAPGEMAAALVGHRLTGHPSARQVPVGGDRRRAGLGLHLGMAGSLTVDEEPAPRNWDRFVLEFDDGGRLALRDKRRLGRAVLDPDFSHVGPDAAEVGREEFRARVGRGTAPLKARLLDQTVISGVGNLLADEILWRARLGPRRVPNELDTAELDRLRRSTRAAMRDAIRLGGAHTGHLIPHRVPAAAARGAEPRPSARRSAGAPRSGARRASYDAAVGLDPPGAGEHVDSPPGLEIRRAVERRAVG